MYHQSASRLGCPLIKVLLRCSSSQMHFALIQESGVFLMMCVFGVVHLSSLLALLAPLQAARLILEMNKTAGAPDNPAATLAAQGSLWQRQTE